MTAYFGGVVFTVVLVPMHVCPVFECLPLERNVVLPSELADFFKNFTLDVFGNFLGLLQRIHDATVPSTRAHWLLQPGLLLRPVNHSPFRATATRPL